MTTLPRSAPRRGLISSSIRLLPLLLCAACATTRANVTIQAALPCAQLIPDDWRQGVKGAPAPTGLTVGDWVAHDDAQTAKLNEANRRTKDSIAIVEKCEVRDAQAAEALKPKPWWKVW